MAYRRTRGFGTIEVMDYGKTAARNVAWVTIGQVGTRILGLGFFLYLAAKLGETAVGTFSFAFALLGIWFALGEFGLFQYLTRKWARDNTGWEQDFRTAMGLKLLSSLAILIFLLGYVILYDHALWSTLLLTFVALFFDQVRAVQEIYLNSQNRFQVAATALILERLVETVVGITLLFLGYGLDVVLGIYIVGRLVAIAYQRWHHAFPWGISLRWKETAAMVRGGFPFLLIGTFTIIYFRIDMVMLRYFGDLDVVGWYSAAYRFVDLIGILPGILATAMTPLFVRALRDRNEHAYQQLFHKAFSYSFILGAGVLVIGGMIAANIIGFFYTAAFNPAIQTLRILLIASFLIFIDYLLLSLLTAEHREKAVLKITATSAAINIGLNMILIPRYSLYGSAWATVITEVFVLVAALSLISVRPRYSQVVKTILAAACTAVVMALIPEIQVILRVIAGGAVYALMLLGLGAVTRSELRWFLALMRRNATIEETAP